MAVFFCVEVELNSCDGMRNETIERLSKLFLCLARVFLSFTPNKWRSRKQEGKLWNKNNTRGKVGLISTSQLLSSLILGATNSLFLKHQYKHLYKSSSKEQLSKWTEVKHQFTFRNSNTVSETVSVLGCNITSIQTFNKLIKTNTFSKAAFNGFKSANILLRGNWKRRRMDFSLLCFSLWCEWTKLWSAALYVVLRCLDQWFKYWSTYRTFHYVQTHLYGVS